MDPAKKFHGTITEGYVSFDTNVDKKQERLEKRMKKAAAREKAREQSNRALETLLLLDIALGIRDRKK